MTFISLEDILPPDAKLGVWHRVMITTSESGIKKSCIPIEPKINRASKRKEKKRK